MTRVLFVGDLHGNTRFFKDEVLKKVVQFQANVIVQVGDFGFWPHYKPYEDQVPIMERAIQKLSEKHEVDLPLVWIDGNHDNFDALYAGEWEKTPRGFWSISEHIAYAPRGHRWEWDGVSFLALGGGNSIDKANRTPGVSWWPQELITMEEVRRCIEGGPVDVLVCHDVPGGVDMGFELRFKNQPEDEANRQRLRMVFDAVKPKLVVHGHYHHFYKTDFEGARVIGLDCDGYHDPESLFWCVVDIEEGEIDSP